MVCVGDSDSDSEDDLGIRTSRRLMKLESESEGQSDDEILTTDSEGKF